MNQVKKQARKFSVINCTETGRAMKFILPLDKYSNKYIQDNVVRTGYDSDDDNLIYDYESFHMSAWGSSRVSSFFKLAKMNGGRIIFPQAYHRLTSTDLGSEFRLKLHDVEIQISASLFDLLKNSFGFKYYEDETRQRRSTNLKVMVMDDSMISDDLTESLCQVGKMVKISNPDEIWGTETLLGYHYSAWHPKIQSNFTKFMDAQNGAVNFGFEAEKQDETYRDMHNAVKLAFETGFKKERDGSLGEGGFELISPVLPLFNDSVVDGAIDSVKDILKAQTSDRCGGHFNISKNGVPSREILKKVKGSLPIFYSIYENRLTNSYCKAEKFATYLRSPRKYQSFYIKSDSILEFRIFPAIKNETILRNRIQLMRIIFNDLYGKTHNGVIVEMAKKNTAIHNFMLNVVCNGDMDKFKSKIKKFIVMASRYNIGQVTANTIKKVEKLMDMQILEPQQVQVSNESTEIEPITSTETQTYWYTNEFNRFTAQFNDGSTYNMNSGEITNTDGILRYVESCGTTIEYSNNGMVEQSNNNEIEVPQTYIDTIAKNMLQEVNVNGENPSSLAELNEMVPCTMDIDLMSDIRRTTLLGIQSSDTHHANVMNLARANGYTMVPLNNQVYSSTEDAHEAMDAIEVNYQNADGELINMNEYMPNTMNKFLKLFIIMYATSKLSNTYLIRNDFEFTFRRGNGSGRVYYASYRTADDGTFMCAFGRRWDGCRFKFIYNENTNSLNILR